MPVGASQSGGGWSRSGGTLPALEAVANRPIAEHALTSLLDLTDGIVFVGEADMLMDLRGAVAESIGRFSQVDYVVAPAAAGLAGAAASVLPHVGDQSCLLWPAHGLLDGDLASVLASIEDEPADVTVLVPASGRAADVGVFGPGVLASIAGEVRGPRMLDLAAAGHHMSGLGMSVDWRSVEGWCCYRGHGSDLLELNRIALERMQGEPVPAHLKAGNTFQGKVVIDPSATVRSSVITGPVVIGPEATVENAYLGPYTSIGAYARIEGTEIERSIVSPGASVIHVGSRLMSSLVGRDARVFRNFELPKALRLWVGDGGDVSLC